jgi:hypothetical protein
MKGFNLVLTQEELNILELVGSTGWSELFSVVDETIASAQSILLSDRTATLEERVYQQGVLYGCSLIPTLINNILEKQEQILTQAMSKGEEK